MSHPEYGHNIWDVNYRALTVNGRIIARVESIYDDNTFENMWDKQKEANNVVGQQISDNQSYA